MAWGEVLTLFLVGLGFFFVIVTKMRQTERGRKSIDWIYGFMKKIKTKKEPEIVNTGGRVWMPPEKII